MSRNARRRWFNKITRDALLFTVGLGLIIREAFSSGPERPSLYILYAGMIGLGPVLRYAEAKQRAQVQDQ